MATVSTSTPTAIETPPSAFTLQLAQLLQQVGASAMQWAQQAYAQTGAITMEQIQNYLKLAGRSLDLADVTYDQYTNTYRPLMDQYAADANTWGSASRIKSEIGSAISDTAQAGNRAKINAENELASFGIDPSSGRYQDLVRVSQTQMAAGAASAAQLARKRVEDEARQRKVDAMMVGLQLPGATVNSLNSAYQGVAGATNAALGLLNSGTNAMAMPANYYGLAMKPLQYPVGNTTKSVSGQPAGGGGGGGGSKSSDPFNMDRFGRTQPNPPPLPQKTYSPYGFGASAGGQPQTIQNPFYEGDYNYDAGNLGGYDPSDPWAGADPAGAAIGDVLQQSGYTNDFGWYGADYSGFNPSDYGNSGWYGDYSQAYDPGSQFGGWYNYSSTPDWGSAGQQPSYDFSYDNGFSGYDMPADWYSGGSNYDYSGYGDYGSYFGGDYQFFAEGGTVNGEDYPETLNPGAVDPTIGRPTLTPRYQRTGEQVADPRQPMGGFPSPQAARQFRAPSPNMPVPQQQAPKEVPGGGWVMNKYGDPSSGRRYEPDMSRYYSNLVQTNGTPAGAARGLGDHYTPAFDYRNSTNKNPREDFLGGSGRTQFAFEAGRGGAFPAAGLPSFGLGSAAHYNFAKGGPVPQRGSQPPGGGYVPPSMSPSGGRQTDDIQAVVPQTGGRAAINAGEFVLPRDVVAWKGQEFFQKMIQQARQARLGAPAKPSRGAPRGGPNG